MRIMVLTDHVVQAMEFQAWFPAHCVESWAAADIEKAVKSVRSFQPHLMLILDTHWLGYTWRFIHAYVSDNPPVKPYIVRGTDKKHLKPVNRALAYEVGADVYTTIPVPLASVTEWLRIAEERQPMA